MAAPAPATDRRNRMDTTRTTATDTTEARRQGPRPLPLHLMTAAWACLSSPGGLALLRQNLLPLKPDLRADAAALLDELKRVDPAKFALALSDEARRLLDQLAAGIQAYRRHPYRRNLSDPPVVWRQGTTRLVDYGGPEDGLPVLMVPSLINRSYILDLSRERSLARHLAAQGLRPLLVDWDRPGDQERRFTLSDYIAGRLEDALDETVKLTKQRPAVLGYCMGGNLALALAERRRRDIVGLALLATPWDFHAGTRVRYEQIMPAMAPGMAAWLEALGELPVDALQMMFYALDPFLVIRKFRQFASLDPESEKARAFVSLEDWLNDGVPLAGPVTQECMQGWYGENLPAKGAWRVAGRPVDPARIELPTLILVPSRDRIVPPASAAALLPAMPGAMAISPPLGHIGMVVAESASRYAWKPLTDFLRSLGAKPRTARAGRGLGGSV